MKYLFVLLFLSLPFSLKAQQSFKFPALPKRGAAAADLVPKGWRVIDSVAGDLNGDRATDLVMVLEYEKPIRETRAYGDNSTEIIAEHQRPRMLAAYFGSHTDKSFRLSLQNNDFILRSNEGGKLGDPYRGIRLNSGALRISFAGGNSWRWTLDYSFRYKGTAWVLTEAASQYFHEETGEMTARNFDFILQEVDVVSGSIHNRASANVSYRESLRDEPLRTFATFKKPWVWEILPGTYL